MPPENKDVDFFKKNYRSWLKAGNYCADKYAKYTYRDKEDLIQEGLLVVWQTILDLEWRTPSFLKDRCRSGIFAAYKRGKSIDNHYQNKNRRRYKVAADAIEDLNIGKGIIDKRADPEEIAISAIMLDTFYNRLGKDEQIFLKLKLAGYYWKEIKKIMGMRRRRLNALLKNIKIAYNQVYEEGDI